MEWEAKLIIPLVIGYFLDLLLGDPHHWIHPVRYFGRWITWGDQKLNFGSYRKLKGFVFALISIFGLFVMMYMGLGFLFERLDSLGYYPVASIFVFWGLANKSLIDESMAVIQKLKDEGLEAGRKRLSWIVGRDTVELSENKVKIAVLETLSENLSDGVVAPLFFYAIAGVPGMMAYKMINTLDSMIGYKSEKYKDFGWAAAKIDDIANYIPARITALLIAMVSGSWRSLLFIWKYGRKHASPNAGFPEAALAGVLNCRFGGPNYYKGVLVDKPYIGQQDKVITNRDIKRTVFINQAVTLVVVTLVLATIILHFKYFANA